MKKTWLGDKNLDQQIFDPICWYKDYAKKLDKIDENSDERQFGLTKICVRSILSTNEFFSNKVVTFTSYIDIGHKHIGLATN